MKIRLQNLKFRKLYKFILETNRYIMDTIISSNSYNNFSLTSLKNNTPDNYISLDNVNYASERWAAGLEMEATYILNPFDSKSISWENGLKEFYVPDFKKIITYIEKKYKNNFNIYKHIVEAEVSGRTCGPPGKKVSVIKPDPKHSMLEIATDRRSSF